MLLLCSGLISIVLSVYYGFTDTVAGKWHRAITGTVAEPENYRRCGKLMISMPHVIGLLLNVLLAELSILLLPVLACWPACWAPAAMLPLASSII
jgi:hypothetical protein